MAIESQRAKKCFFSYKESTPGTPNTTAFFEGRGMMALPSTEPQLESDKMKLGSGEHGTKSEIQAIWTPFSYTCDRMSELAYFLSYFQGRPYTVSPSGSLERHELFHFGTEEMTLPSFTIEYGLGGTGNNSVIAGCTVNEFSITFSSGGNGRVEATFSGWGNRHYWNAGAITERPAGNMNTGDNNLFDFGSEPIVNYKCCNLWVADTADHVKGDSVDFTGENLGANLINLTTLLNSITLSGNNGATVADKARAGGYGIVNDFVRGDRSYNLEINLRKNLSTLDTDAAIIANTQRAVELLFNGKYISGTDPYAIDFFWPKVQFIGDAQDDASPISITLPCEVFEDTTNSAFEVFVQSQIGTAYNATI